MKNFKRVLSFMLSMLMIFSCLSVVASAAGEQIESSFKYYTEKDERYNLKVTLDKVDEFLKKKNLSKTIEIGSREILIDLRSIDAICKTIDDYYRIVFLASLAGEFVLGDLADIDLTCWQEGMSRRNDEVLIVKEFIELLYENRSFVSKICTGKINIGILGDDIELEKYIGEGGVSGIIKKLLIGFVYEDGSDEYKTAYAQYKNDIDSFIYEELISNLTGKYLPGFTANSTSTVEQLICSALDISIDKYLTEKAKKLDVDLAASGVPALKALDGIVNLKGSTYDFSEIAFDEAKPLVDQLNGFFGAVAKQLVPSYTYWVNGGYDLIDENLEGLLRYVGKNSGLVPDADVLNLEELVYEAALIVLSNADFGAYENGLAECDNLESMATALLKNVADKMCIGVKYSSDDSYLVVLGDLFAYWFYDKFDIKEFSGKSYQAGGKKDIFEVANYYLNYFLFEKGCAAFMGLEVTESESVFVKLDKILDYFGETKAKGVSFNSKEILLGSAEKKGLLDSIFTVDIENLLSLTFVPAVNNAGDIPAGEFLYKSIQYFLNNWAGDTLLPEYVADKAFENALSDNSIANMVSVFATILYNRTASFTTLASFVAALIFKEEKLSYEVTEAVVKDCFATEDTACPEVSVSLDGKKLVQGKDFIVQTTAKTPGAAKATIRFIGMYSGKLERSFNVVMDNVKRITSVNTANSVKFAWNKIAYADGYNIHVLKNGEYVLVNDELVTENAFLLTGLSAATEYKIRIDAVSNAYGTAKGEEIYISTIPEVVNPSTIRVKTNEKAAFIAWLPSEGATHYKVEKYVGSNNWQRVAVTEVNSILVEDLEGFTTYNFRITALKLLSNGNYVSSTPTSVKVKTLLDTVENVAMSYTSTSITLKWTPAKNAQAYQVFKKENGVWKFVTVVTSPTAYKFSGLKATTNYEFAIRAAAKENGKWLFGGYKFVNQSTGFAKPTVFRVAAVNANAAKLAWTAVPKATGYQIFQFINGKWVGKAVTTNTNIIIGGLPSGVEAFFMVRGFTVVNGAYLFGDLTNYVTALTLPAKVSGLKTVYRKPAEIGLTWNKQAGATGYQVFRYDNGNWVSLGVTLGNTWVDKKNLAKSTKYFYMVRAVQKVGTTYRFGAVSSILAAETTALLTVYN